MKHLLTIFALLLTLSCCTSEGEKTRMREGLDSLNQRNRNDEAITKEEAHQYVSYFDVNGTDNERMLAHYLMGRCYHIQGESPQALLEYYKAIGSVDTIDEHVDFKQLSRIYGQIATVYHQQKALLLELSAQKEAERTAIKGKDTLSAIFFHLNLSRAYYMLDMTDSALMVCLEANQKFQKMGYQELAANCLPTAIEIWIKDGNFDKAIESLHIYEQFGNIFDDRGNVAPGKAFYYRLKGQIYEHQKNFDSAKICYHKLLSAPYCLNNAEGAYRGLMSTYQHMARYDSASIYAELLCRVNDSINLTETSDEIIRMQAVYNYEYNREKAIAEKKKAEKYERWLILSSLAIIMTILIFIRIWIYKREKYKMQLKAVITNYQDSYDKYLQLSKDIQLLRNNSEAYKKEQELKIEELRQILQTYDTDKKIIETSEAERKIYDSPMVAQFHNLAKHIKRPTPNEWRKMEESMQVLMPGFMNFLSEHQSELTPQESHIMLLIKLQFITSEIYALMNLKAQRLTNIRSAINKKLFQMKGSPSLEQNINNIRIE